MSNTIFLVVDGSVDDDEIHGDIGGIFTTLELAREAVLNNLEGERFKEEKPNFWRVGTHYGMVQIVERELNPKEIFKND